MRSVLTAVAAAMLVGCAGESDPSVRVDPVTSLADEPVHIDVHGLEPGQAAKVHLRSVDSSGVGWAASATFAADRDGNLDLDRASPRSGSYTGVSESGLIWAMQPLTTAPAGAYFWRSEKPLRFTASVEAGGGTVATTTFERRLMRAKVVARRLSVQRDGLAGSFLSTSTAERRPAILMLGGSGGGIPGGLEVGLLAGRGYPVLALAYFREPGLPETLSAIPLEYFERGLRWLARQPQVDPSRVVTWGVSRGSEAALLLGVHYPALVRGVVALVPSNVALCSYPRCAGLEWTLRGRALPFTRQIDAPRPIDEPRAVIPVERIDGPLLLVCGGRDATWNSCAYTQAIAARLDARGHRHGHRSYAYASAGHGIGFLAPYMPLVPRDPTIFDDEQRARVDVWPHVLEFLAELRRRR